MPHSMAITVEPPAMRMELVRYLAMGARLQMSMKLDQRVVTGRMVDWPRAMLAKISDRPFRAVHSMAK